MSATQPVRLQLSRRKGFNLQQWSRKVNGLPAVNVARPSKWGNPFRVGGAMQAFRNDAAPHDVVLIDPSSAYECVAAFRWRVEHSSRKDCVEELRGKNLACWCALDGGPCHADVLLELANAGDKP